MRRQRLWRILVGTAALLAACALTAGPALAAQPVVKVVPWVASNPLIPHDTWSGKSVRLKGTVNLQGATIQYIWDFGDGSPVATGIVSNMYAVEASHAYTGSVGTVFTARLTVQDTSTGESDNKAYFVGIQAKALPVEVNVAIDEGLWYLHKTQTRSGDVGYWTSGYAGSGYYGITALDINAFEVNGHLESGSADNPYVETVARGLRRLFTYLTSSAIGMQNNGLGTFNPDSNGNGRAIFVNQGNPYYQGGMLVDAIVASGTPNAVASTGPVGVVGLTYRAIVQDMVDGYAYGQYDSYAAGGGWRYSTNQWPDNSACQWGAIAIIPAEREWGVVVPRIVKDWNEVWLNYSQAASGVFGYTDPNPIWGPYATTPSGMVQLAMDGHGRGNLLWDRAEAYMGNNFGNTGSAYYAVKNYYYGLFSFVKSLLLHDSNGDGIAEPIQMLHATSHPDIDWYSAEASAGAWTDGVARKLVNDQNAAGYWYGHNYSSDQYTMETGIAIIILNRTIFTAGAPVAVATATPNPAVAGQTITLSGQSSYHQDAGKQIVSWEWDLDNNGTWDATGVTATISFPVVGNYPVRLRVTDDGAPSSTAETTVIVMVATPPLAPTAKAGGPYSFCPAAKPWFLDGTLSSNPDDGQHEPGAPGDFIKSFGWDLNGDGVFDNATGQVPDVTAFFTAAGPGSYLIQLKVTDNTLLSFPSSGLGDLSDTDSGTVVVRTALDPRCGCISNLAARPKSGKLQLTWTATGAHHYNVYRSTVSGGPYLLIASTASTYATYLDLTVVNGTTYYYVVRPAAINGDELCQSNQAMGRPVAIR